MKQAHNHDPAQMALLDQERPATRRDDPETSHAAAASVGNLRASHRRVLQLFRLYGSQTDEQLMDSAKAEGWKISPSGLRTRRSELTSPRGIGIIDTGRRVKTESGRDAIVWGLADGI